MKAQVTSGSTSLDLGDVAERLGIPRLRIWVEALTGNFAEPVESSRSSRTSRWDPAAVDRWALDHGFSHRVPLETWPAAHQPRFLEAYPLTGAIAQCWDHQSGTVAVIWTLDDRQPSLARLATEILQANPSVRAMARVLLDFGARGYPGIQGCFVQPESPPASTRPPQRRIGRGGKADRDGKAGLDPVTYLVSWQDLSKVLGFPLPYWPAALRRADLITNWEPGAAAVTALAHPYLDTAALLQLAAIYDQDHASAKVLTQLARAAMSSSADSAEHTIQMLRKRVPQDNDQITVAAQPIPVPSDRDGDELSSAARRAGWLDILGRSDDLAATCVSQAMMQNGGEDFPYSNPERITPGSTPACIEWVARLQPAPTPRPAAFQILARRDEQGQALIDPETDAPAWHADDEDTIDAAIPQRIPAQAPLAEVILDDPIWVRTSDGKIWPAPKDSYYGLSWGYQGSGPGTLALLIGRLLDDINTAAAADVRGEEALEALLELTHPRGTILARTDLEHVRAGHGIPPHLRRAPTGDHDGHGEDEDD